MSLKIIAPILPTGKVFQVILQAHIHKHRYIQKKLSAREPAAHYRASAFSLADKKQSWDIQ